MCKKLLRLQLDTDKEMIEKEKNYKFVNTYKGILFPEDLLFRRKVAKDPYLSKLQNKSEKKKSASVVSLDAKNVGTSDNPNLSNSDTIIIQPKSDIKS